MTRPKLVATDLDGTLLDASGAVSQRTGEVLAALDSAGVPVVIVTGRPRRWIEDLHQYVGAHGLAIVSNGALVWDVGAGAAHLTRTIDAEVGRGIARDLRAAVPGTSYAVENLAGIGLEAQFMERHPKPPDSRIAPVEDLLDTPALKILARHEDLDPQEFWTRGLAAVGERGTVTISTTRTALLEISAADVTKATTLAIVAAQLGVDPADVIAFGDMPNDLPMLTWAGTSYAMAGGHPTVLAEAGNVAPPHDEDGVAQVLAAVFGLPGPTVGPR